MRRKRFRAGALLLSTFLTFGAVAASGAIMASASETPSSVEYVFTGDEANVAGFAQGTITVTPGDGAASKGYYLVYYTDGEQVLQDYDELATVKITGKAVKYTVGDGLMLPTDAKGIAVFESETRFLDDPPAIETAIATAEIPQEKQLSSLGEKQYSFGLLSDSHMNYEPYDRGAFRKLKNAMNFFASAGMESVIIAGDATGDRGEKPDLEAQYEKHIEIINGSDFDFAKVYEGIGNHGNTPSDAPLLAQYLSGGDEVHPYENSPYFSVMLGGNLFIFMAQEINAPGDSASYDNFSAEQIDWVEGLLTEYGNTETNIFIIIHAPFLNHGAGDRKNGSYTACIKFDTKFTQTMRLKALLETYKDAVVFSGHTHVTFYDGANYSDEYNSFARTVHVGSTCQPCGYGDGAYTRSYDGRYTVTPEYGSEGYTVEIYDDFIVFTGYNFSTGKKVPAACLLLPVHAYGGEGKPEEPKVPTPEETFAGSGTAQDPYLISDADDFYALTVGFNASTSATETEMYGYGLYFEQTADIDMTDYEGYSGTGANGDAKCFFAGTYNGNGYSLTVDIQDSYQRSVFPYVYGVLYNVVIQGSIAAEESAQPVRTLYGSLVNCEFALTLSANKANGVAYSNYGTVINVYAHGVLSGASPCASLLNSSSSDVTNLFHNYRTDAGETVSGSAGTAKSDPQQVASAFTERDASWYIRAKKLTGGILCDVTAGDGGLLFMHAARETVAPTESTAESTDESVVSEESTPSVSDSESSNVETKKNGMPWGLLAVLGAVLIVGGIGAAVWKKNKKA